MDENKIICHCNQVTYSGIKKAIESGATTLEAIQEITAAGTICGGCIEEIEKIIDELKA